MRENGYFHFNPLPPHGGRPSVTSLFVLPGVISIHSLRMEGDVPRRPCGGQQKNFNPLPPHGGRRNQHGYQDTENGFQSTPSVWRETLGATVDFVHWVFQSPPSVWRETVYGISGNVDLNISIHSLRMEGDDITFLHFDVQSISIHSLRMEGDVAESVHFDRRKTFQSTPSVWRETDRQAAAFFPIRYFNPLPPYGGRQSHQT